MREVIVNGEVKLEHEAARIPVRTKRAPGERDAARIAKARARVDEMEERIRVKRIQSGCNRITQALNQIEEAIITDTDENRRRVRGEIVDGIVACIEAFGLSGVEESVGDALDSEPKEMPF